MTRPQPTEYASFYAPYISLALGNSVAEIIENYSQLIENFYNNLPEAKANYAYAIGKWTIKDLDRKSVV